MEGKRTAKITHPGAYEIEAIMSVCRNFGRFKPNPIIGNRQDQTLLLPKKIYANPAGLSMLFDVAQCFAENIKELA